MKDKEFYDYKIICPYGFYSIQGDDYNVTQDDHLRIVKDNKVIAYFKDWSHVEEKPID